MVEVSSARLCEKSSIGLNNYAVASSETSMNHRRGLDRSQTLLLPERLEVFSLKKPPNLPGNPEYVVSPKEKLELLIWRVSGKTKRYINTVHNAAIAKQVAVSSLRSLSPRTQAELLDAAGIAFDAILPADSHGFFLHTRYAI